MNNLREEGSSVHSMTPSSSRQLLSTSSIDLPFSLVRRSGRGRLSIGESSSELLSGYLTLFLLRGRASGGCFPVPSETISMVSEPLLLRCGILGACLLMGASFFTFFWAPERVTRTEGPGLDDEISSGDSGTSMAFVFFTDVLAGLTARRGGP